MQTALSAWDILHLSAGPIHPWWQIYRSVDSDRDNDGDNDGDNDDDDDDDDDDGGGDGDNDDGHGFWSSHHSRPMATVPRGSTHIHNFLNNQ